jgi:aspartate carbamoyltransferase catalytic subunit
MTRIQDEHDKSGESKGVDYSPFHFKSEHLKLIKKSCVIMHPLPRRHEIEVSVDADPRAVFWRQERNGMWARAALMSYIFNVDRKIER